MIPNVQEAVRAAQDRKAVDLQVLDLTGISSFTDFFLVCSGTSSRHTQAISDAVVEQLEKSAVTPAHVEGYNQAEWILLDYVDFVVHIFSEEARHYYDLERLWRKAARIPVEGTEKLDK
jgi:ribosome-associated protein